MFLNKVSQAIRHKLIKVPIQPVNKLLNRVGRSNSQQQLTNLETDENEKLIVKLFGTKFIEKTSMVAPLIIHSPIETNDQLTNTNEIEASKRRGSLTSI